MKRDLKANIKDNTINELKTIAKYLNIKGVTRAKKQDLLDAIKMKSKFL